MKTQECPPVDDQADQDPDRTLDAQPKRKRVVTDKMAAANRENALKSTGPKTALGKRISRRNSLKHGMRSKDDILPHALAEQVQKGYLQWAAQLRPEGLVEATLIKRAVASTVKLDWLDSQFYQVVAKQTEEAGDRFDERERRCARLEAQNLENDPSGTVQMLRNSIAGCDWLADRWTELQDRLKDGLDADQVALALRLLGFDPSKPLCSDAEPIRHLLDGTRPEADRLPGPDGKPFDVESVRELASTMMDHSLAGLESRRAELAAAHEEIRRQATAGAMLPQGKLGAIWPRYQAIHSKQFHQAIHDLIKIRKLDDPPRPDDFRRDASRDRWEEDSRFEGAGGSVGADGSEVSERFREAMEAGERAETALKDRELRTLRRKLEHLELQSAAKDALIRRMERQGCSRPNEAVKPVETRMERASDLAPNEAVKPAEPRMERASDLAPNEAVKPVETAENASNSPRGASILGQIWKIAGVLLILLLSARTLGAGKGGMEGSVSAAKPIGNEASGFFRRSPLVLGGISRLRDPSSRPFDERTGRATRPRFGAIKP